MRTRVTLLILLMSVDAHAYLTVPGPGPDDPPGTLMDHYGWAAIGPGLPVVDAPLTCLPQVACGTEQPLLYNPHYFDTATTLELIVQSATRTGVVERDYLGADAVRQFVLNPDNGIAAQIGIGSPPTPQAGAAYLGSLQSFYDYFEGGSPSQEIPSWRSLYLWANGVYSCRYCVADPVVTPEPNLLYLTLTGLVALAVLWRRRAR